jgi:hypothetical protein
MTREWDADDRVDPLRGPKGDTQFFKENFKYSAVGSIFRTVKARFTPEKIHAEAKKAGWTVRIDDETPWLRVEVVGKA